MMKRTMFVLAVVAATSVAAAESGLPTADYLTPELRERVEKLKAEAEVPSDSPDVLLDRLRTLWEWSNAYALAGGMLPIDHSMAVSLANRVLSGRGEVEGMPFKRAATYITQMTRELAIKDEIPGAMGPITLDSTGPFQAGEFVTIEETYVMGEMPIPPGGGFMVAQPTRWTQRAPSATELTQPYGVDALHLQATDPAADNHVTIRSSNTGARFTVTEPDKGWRLFNVVPFVFFELEGATLEPGDTVTVTFGDRSGGSRGMRVQHWTNDRVLLPIYPVFDGDTFPVTPPWPTYSVIGRAEVRRAEVVVRPSVVAPGEEFEVVVRSEDRYRQLSSGRTPEYQLFRNGEPIRVIAAGSPAVTVLSGQRVAEPGVYRFSVRSADGKLWARSNPVWVREESGDGIYWGDTHGHTGFADGQGTPDNYYLFARDVARLDFVTLSEHGIWMDDAEWRILQEMVRKYNDPGSFSAILGYEWTANAEFGGHHNVYFRDPDGRKRVTNLVNTSLQDLYDGLRAAHRTDDVLIIPHAHQPGDWRQNDADMERLVEVNSGHGVFEWYGNRYMQQGFDVGFIGSSDDHTGHPGYLGMTHVQFTGLAAVIAPANRDELIFDAMRARSAYATTGERIILDAEFNGHRMGSRVPAGEGRTIRCRVMGTEPIEAVDLIRNGELIYSRSYLNPRIESRAVVQFSVSSSTEVEEFRSPQGPRYWRGTIELNGGELIGYRLPWFVNPTRYHVGRDPDDPNRIEFRANTRGRSKGLLLELDGVTAETEIRVTLGKGSAEAGKGLSARLGDLVDAPAATEFGDGVATDAIRLTLVPDEAALDLDFEFKDLDPRAVGDYYYIRVRQVGGGMAFSSPWRIVGE
jgi:hypothetical protein